MAVVLSEKQGVTCPPKTDPHQRQNFSVFVSALGISELGPLVPRWLSKRCPSRCCPLLECGHPGRETAQGRIPGLAPAIWAETTDAAAFARHVPDVRADCGEHVH